MNAKNENYNLIGSREEIDNYTMKLLESDSDFRADLEIIRNDFLIPEHINPGTDMYISAFENENYDDLFGSVYVNELMNKENRDRFKKAIIKIINKYELGLNFVTYIQALILYREQFFEEIPINSKMFDQIRIDIGELFRAPKNTQEKNMILRWVKKLKGIPDTGRIPNEHKEFIKKLKSYLERKKIKIRKPRIDHSVDFEISKRIGKDIPLPGLEFEGPVKNTYTNLSNAFSEDILNDDENKLIQRNQKRQQRLKKQAQKLKK